MDTCCVWGPGALAGKPGQVQLLEDWFSLSYLLEELHYSPLKYWSFQTNCYNKEKEKMFKYAEAERHRG